MSLLLFTLFLFLQLGDLYSTKMGLKAGAVEGNPLFTKLFGKKPTMAQFVLVKAPVVGFAGWYFFTTPWQDTLMPMAAVSVVYIWIIQNNLKIAKKGK